MKVMMKAQLHQFNGLLCGLHDEVKKLTNTLYIYLLKYQTSSKVGTMRVSKDSTDNISHYATLSDEPDAETDISMHAY